MNYANLKYCDVVNGFGMRTTLYVSGCKHACVGCFNLEAQDFNVGKEFTDDTINTIIESMKPEYIQGLTLLGGEPMDPANQPSVHKLIKEVRRVFGNTKNIWMWTGYVYPRDFMFENGPRARAYTKFSDDILMNTDVLVDGPFVAGLFSLKLKFRGSANQKIIDLKKSLMNNDIVLLDVNEDPAVVQEVYEKARSKEKSNP